MTTKPSKHLETFPNPRPGRHYSVEFECPEFTCVCPMTGQPDFADIRISYIPDEKCVELKSLKLYLWSFRQTGAFHEDVTNTILDDLVRALKPLALEVVGDFNIRGGIHTIVTASYPDELEGVDECCGGAHGPAEKQPSRKGGKARAGKKS